MVSFVGLLILVRVLFYYAAGAEDAWTAVSVGGSMGGFCFVFGVLFFWSNLSAGLKAHDKSVRRVLAGDPCTATIVTAVQLRSYAEPNSANQGIVSVRLELLVHLSDGRDEHASWTGGVDMVTCNKVVEGKVLNVVVDPSDLTNLFIEW